MSERLASFGWERWPVRKTLDGSTYLCRWCAKPLKGGSNTAFCSDQCEREVRIRCDLKSMRNAIYRRDEGICAECRVDINDLEQAFKYIHELWLKNKLFYFSATAVRKAAGYASSGHLWELNHKKALAEGGDPIDPDNLEILCLKCHRKHTAALAKRLADERRAAKKAEKLKIQPVLTV